MLVVLGGSGSWWSGLGVLVVGGLGGPGGLGGDCGSLLLVVLGVLWWPCWIVAV